MVDSSVMSVPRLVVRDIKKSCDVLSTLSGVLRGVTVNHEAIAGMRADVFIASTRAAAIDCAACDNDPLVLKIADGSNIDADVDANVTLYASAMGETPISIAGSPTGNAAIERHVGATQVFDPLVKNGRCNGAYNRCEPGQSNAAQAETNPARNTLGNKVDGVFVAIDGMAGHVVVARRAQQLDDKVLVAGQDVTIARSQHIFTGEYGMSNHIPIRKLADAAVQLPNAYLRQKKQKPAAAPKNGKIHVSTVLLPVATVTKTNIKSTVVADGFVTKEQFSNGTPAYACSVL